MLSLVESEKNAYIRGLMSRFWSEALVFNLLIVEALAGGVPVQGGLSPALSTNSLYLA